MASDFSTGSEDSDNFQGHSRSFETEPATFGNLLSIHSDIKYKNIMKEAKFNNFITFLYV